MKTKTFLLLFLFLCIANTKMLAQSSDLEKNHTYVSETSQVLSIFPVECNGGPIEILTGYMDIRTIEHFNNGQWEFGIAINKGEYISSTGENFKTSELDKSSTPLWKLLNFHGNLKGDRGTHYIISGSIDYSTIPLSVTIDKALCIVNGKNK
jgi:hypothetical protein